MRGHEEADGRRSACRVDRAREDRASSERDVPAGPVRAASRRPQSGDRRDRCDLVGSGRRRTLGIRSEDFHVAEKERRRGRNGDPPAGAYGLLSIERLQRGRAAPPAPQPVATAITGHGNIGIAGFVAPGTFTLAMVFLVAFVLYYFVNWKYLSTVWPLS